MPTKTPIPIGSSGNPLTIGFVDPVDSNINDSKKTLVDQLANLTGFDVQAVQFSNYNELMDKMRNNQVHLAWLQPFTYIYGKQNGFARVLLLTNHFGVFQYGTQFMANSSSGFTAYYDPSTGKNTRDEAFALTQFQGKRPCWVDPTSASGYILPLSQLAENKIGVFEGVFSHNHAAVIRSLYVNGICDFGATFSISGDPRTSSTVLEDSPDVINRVPILWRSEAVIPNTNLTIQSEISPQIADKISAAFMEIVKTPDGRQIISDALNYNVEDLQPVNDDVYKPLEHAIDILGLDIETLIGK
jgi:phosphonate transport system substrate-binding protein